MHRFAGSLRRWAADLFDQQLWCWGRDIARPAGNVLLQLGMCRHRCSDPKVGSTLYIASPDKDAALWLWGFGLLYRRRDLGCVFLRRHGFDLRLVGNPPERPVHRVEEVGPLVRQMGAEKIAAEALLRDAALWIAGYEHWVAENLGIDYRRAVLKAREKRPTVPAQEMAASWERVAKKSFRLSVAMPVAGPWGQLLAALRFALDDPYRHRSTEVKRWRRETRTRGPT